MSERPDPILCPACGNEFIPTDQNLQQCPACQEQFFIQRSDETSDEDAQTRWELEQHVRHKQDRLNEKHIRIIQLEKRSLYRKRTWMLVLGLGMLGLAGQLIWRGIEWFLMHRSYSLVLAYLVVATVLVVVSIRFFTKARHYSGLARQMGLPEPTEPPDFSTLRDGSQFVENLNQLTRRPHNPTGPE